MMDAVTSAGSWGGAVGAEIKVGVLIPIRSVACGQMGVLNPQNETFGRTARYCVEKSVRLHGLRVEMLIELEDRSHPLNAELVGHAPSTL